MANSRANQNGKFSLAEFIQQPKEQFFALNSVERAELLQQQIKAVFHHLAWLEEQERSQILIDLDGVESLQRVRHKLVDMLNEIHEAWILDNKQDRIQNKLYDYLKLLALFVSRINSLLDQIEKILANKKLNEIDIILVDQNKQKMSLKDYLQLCANLFNQTTLNDDIENMISHHVHVATIEQKDTLSTTFHHLPDDIVKSELTDFLPVNDLLALKTVSSRFNRMFAASSKDDSVWRRKIIQMLDGDEAAVAIFEILASKLGVIEVNYHLTATRMQRYMHASRRLIETDQYTHYTWSTHSTMMDKINLLTVCLNSADLDVYDYINPYITPETALSILRQELVLCVMAGAEQSYLTLRKSVIKNDWQLPDGDLGLLDDLCIEMLLIVGNIDWLNKYFYQKHVRVVALKLDTPDSMRMVPPSSADKLLIMHKKSVQYLIDGFSDFSTQGSENQKAYLASLARLLRVCCLSGYHDGARQIKTHVTESVWTAITRSDYMNDIDPGGDYTRASRSVLFLAIAAGDLCTVNEIVMDFYDNDYKRYINLRHSNGTGISYAQTWERMILFSALLSGHTNVVEYALSLSTIIKDKKNVDLFSLITFELLEKSHSAARVSAWLQIMSKHLLPDIYREIQISCAESIGQFGFIPGLKGTEQEYQTFFSMLEVNEKDPTYWYQILDSALRQKNSLLGAFVMQHCLRNRHISNDDIEKIMLNRDIEAARATVLATLNEASHFFAPSTDFWTMLFKSDSLSVKSVDEISTFFMAEQSRLRLLLTLFDQHKIFLTNIADLFENALNSLADRSRSSNLCARMFCVLLLAKLYQNKLTADEVFSLLNNAYAHTQEIILIQIGKILSHQDSIGMKAEHVDKLSQALKRLISNLDDNPDNSILMQATIEYSKQAIKQQPNQSMRP